MPTLSVDAFKEMPVFIQQQLVEVFDCAQQCTERKTLIASQITDERDYLLKE